MGTRIYQFGKKVAYSFPVILFLYRKTYRITIPVCRFCEKLVYSSIATVPVIGAHFRRKSIKELASQKDIRFLLNSLFNNTEEGREFLTSLPTNILLNRRTLIRKLGELEKEKIKEVLDLSRKTVAIFFPTTGYREHTGNIANRLRSKGHNVLTLIGTVCNDQYEKQKYVYYGGNNIINDLDFINIVIEVSPTFNRPGNARKVYFVHDIYDSPIGNVDSFSRYVLGCDYLFLPSHYVVERCKQLVSLARGKFSGDIVKNKQVCLIPGGYIKLDRNLEYFEKHKQEAKVLIYAPTLTEIVRGGMGNITSVPEYGDKIIGAILDHFTDYDLIFRPHPHALHTTEVQRIAIKYANHPRFIFDDKESSYMDNYSKSALMITDMSGTAYTYAFTTLRPVIFFSHNESEARKRFKGFKYFEDRSKVGCAAENIDEMIDKIKLLLATKDEFSSRIKECRDSLIYNIGKAEDYFVDNFEYIIEDKKHPDWVYL